MRHLPENVIKCKKPCCITSIETNCDLITIGKISLLIL